MRDRLLVEGERERGGLRGRLYLDTSAYKRQCSVLPQRGGLQGGGKPECAPVVRMSDTKGLPRKALGCQAFCTREKEPGPVSIGRGQEKAGAGELEKLLWYSPGEGVRNKKNVTIATPSLWLRRKQKSDLTKRAVEHTTPGG